MYEYAKIMCAWRVVVEALCNELWENLHTCKPSARKFGHGWNCFWIGVSESSGCGRCRQLVWPPWNNLAQFFGLLCFVQASKYASHWWATNYAYVMQGNTSRRTHLAMVVHTWSINPDNPSCQRQHTYHGSTSDVTFSTTHSLCHVSASAGDSISTPCLLWFEAYLAVIRTRPLNAATAASAPACSAP